MLALDTTLHCIEADESEVIAVYQSDSPVTVAVAGLTPSPCEAYVCAVRKQESILVYAALLTNRKKVLVYKPTQQPQNEASVSGVLREGVAFAEGMGFRMESINLNYSSAMRAVVVRNISVLRPVKKKEVKEKEEPEKAAEGKAGSQDSKKTEAGEKVTVEPLVEKVADPTPAKKSTHPKRDEVPSIDGAAAIRAELEMVKEEKERNEAASARDLRDLKGQLSSMQTENAALKEQVTRQLSRLQTENASLKEQVTRLESSAAASTSQLRDDLAKVQEQHSMAQAEIVRVTKEKEQRASALSKDAAQLRDQVASLSAGLAAAGKREETHAETIASLQEQLSVSLNDNKTLLHDRDKALKEISELQAAQEKLQVSLSALRTETEGNKGSRQEFDAKLSALREENRRIELERSALMNQKATLLSARDVAENHASALLAERDALAQELAALKGQPFAPGVLPMREIPRASSPVAPPVAEAAHLPFEEKEDVRSDVSPIASPVTEAAPLPPEEKEGPLHDVSPVAEVTQAPFEGKSDVPCDVSPERVSVAEAAPSPSKEEQRDPLPDVFPEAPLRAETPQLPSEEKGDLRIGFFDDDSGQTDPFSSFGSGFSDATPMLFVYQKEIPAISYRTPEDILALMQSVNTARITPEGGEPPGNGKAYICSVRHGDRIEVAVALHLLESGRIYVYHPESQPSDAGSVEKTLQGAVIFAEMVGFMMEPDGLPNDTDKRISLFAGIPVLSRG